LRNDRINQAMLARRQTPDAVIFIFFFGFGSVPIPHDSLGEIAIGDALCQSVSHDCWLTCALRQVQRQGGEHSLICCSEIPL